MPRVDTDEPVKYLNERVLTLAPGSPASIDRLMQWQESRRRLPNLAKVAQRLLCVPASSASSERAFSSAGIAVSHRRTPLDPDTVENILFIHSNA